MNYPLWDLPAPGLLIAAVAILHVFISHFAVGGGLFLVVTERKARREGDAELLSFVKQSDAYRSIPLVIVSTEGSERDRERGLALGADAYLVKPFEPEDLCAVVGDLLDAGRRGR